jgi:hypothetical protein
MTRDEATRLITRYRDALTWVAQRHIHPVDMEEARACVWAARILDSYAECVSPDNETMQEELEMAEAWCPGQQVLMVGQTTAIHGVAAPQSAQPKPDGEEE